MSLDQPYAPHPVLAEVGLERASQDARWGRQDHQPAVFLAILTEEVGEVAKEVADGFASCSPTAGFNAPAYRAELVQVAAVAVCAIEALDRAM